MGEIQNRRRRAAYARHSHAVVVAMRQSPRLSDASWSHECHWHHPRRAKAASSSQPRGSLSSVAALTADLFSPLPSNLRSLPRSASVAGFGRPSTCQNRREASQRDLTQFKVHGTAARYRCSRHWLALYPSVPWPRGTNQRWYQLHIFHSHRKSSSG